jgi:hypothetical protein
MAAKKAFLLRLDPKVWVELERLAQSDLRSVNAEIEYLLREALARRGVAPSAHPADADADADAEDGAARR